MTEKIYDYIIIGSGIAGLYYGYKLKTYYPNCKFLILERYKKKYIGGRCGNYKFYGVDVVTGAGVGRLAKDKLLMDLIKKLKITYNIRDVKPYYSENIKRINIINELKNLRSSYKKFCESISHNGINKENREKLEISKIPKLTFRQFASSKLGTIYYKNFITNAGYSDYENEDVYETLYYYGMEDNACCWKSVHLLWNQLISALVNVIGIQNIKFSQNVISLSSFNNNNNNNLIIVNCEYKHADEVKILDYYTKKVIVATNINSLRKLFPQHSIYNEIECQPFLRLYAKFSLKSVPLLHKYIKGYTFVTGPLQKIIPIDIERGIIMIAYNDNKNSIAVKPYIENNEFNRHFFTELFCKTFSLHKYETNDEIFKLKIISLKSFYWSCGTHYYKPLNTKNYNSREQFIYLAQHPEPNINVIGEVVSRNQGWVEGALESVVNVWKK